MITSSAELLRRSHDAIDGLAIAVRSAADAADRRARFAELSAAVAMHIAREPLAQRAHGRRGGT